MAISFDWSQVIASLPGNPIPAAWINTKGASVKVAFADTGVNLDLGPLKHLNKPGRKFFTGAPGFSVSKTVGKDVVMDSFGAADRGHGNKYASLLAGKKPEDPNFSGDLVMGIAPAADYHIIKVRDQTDKKTTIRNLLDALELSANLGVEIFITGQNIRLSQLTNEGIALSEVDRVFSLPGVKKMHIFAPLENRAAGEPWDNITSNYFPSFRPEVINVAELPEDFDQVSGKVDAQPIPFLLAGFQGELLAKNGVATEISSFSNSGAVAILGGIAVLAVSFFKSQNGQQAPNKAQLMDLLNAACQALDNALGAFESPAIFKNS